MKLYLAMWVRGPLKDKITIEEMNKNKQRAVIYAEQLEKDLGKTIHLYFHTPIKFLLKSMKHGQKTGHLIGLIKQCLVVMLY